jgi:DNA-binding beta-propeller fold protein YncE
LASAGADLVVADTKNNRVQLWNPAQPTAPVVWTATGFNLPKAVAATANDVFVADSGNNQVVELSLTTGQVVQTLAAGKIMDPEGIAVTALGNIWVTATGTNQLIELDPTGNVLETYGTTGSATGQFNHPTHLIVVAGTTEELYVMDTDNGRCQVFAVTGS